MSWAAANLFCPVVHTFSYAGVFPLPALSLHILLRYEPRTHKHGSNVHVVRRYYAGERHRTRVTSRGVGTTRSEGRAPTRRTTYVGDITRDRPLETDMHEGDITRDHTGTTPTRPTLHEGDITRSGHHTGVNPHKTDNARGRHHTRSAPHKERTPTRPTPHEGDITQNRHHKGTNPHETDNVRGRHHTK